MPMVANLKDIRPPFYRLEEYYALDQASDARYEYWDGDIVCMSGGGKAHYQISDNSFYRLRQKLSGGPCRAFAAGLPVKTPTVKPYRYPDATVVCGEPQFENIGGIDVLTNPVLIVKVLSPTTEALDREDKFNAYQAIPTFAEYLLLAQKTPHVTHYARQSDGKWTREDVTDLDATLTLDSIGCTVSLAELYEDVDF
jgi:Uma2 family endonuclease